MYVSDRHPNPPRTTGAPADDGRNLATIPRGDGREELRVTLKTFQGRQYFSLRVWAADRGGEFWPVKSKGVSVRMGEAATVAEALLAAVDLAGRDH